jgi:serine/threonine protein kinase
LYKKVLEKSDVVAIDLIDRMIRVNPKERISARTALNHEWFSDLDKTPFAEQIKFLNLI